MDGRNVERMSHGPEEDDVLYLQKHHRSRHVYMGAIDEVVTQRHRPTGFFYDEADGRLINIHDRVLEYLHAMGFYGVYCCGNRDVDSHLITALIERWRPETHTFHFPIGEATVTLEDVAVIWGLHIRGDPIIGTDTYPAQYNSWTEYCFVMLGFVPVGRELDCSRLKMLAIKAHMQNTDIDNLTPNGIVLQQARCVALLLLGSLMCPDTSGNRVSLIYLHHMETVEQCRNCSWGSAVLSFLYRELCCASRAGKTNKTLGGALQLMQIWAWIRISPTSPIRLSERFQTGPTTLANGRILPTPPLSVRWAAHLSFTQTASHNVRIFRDMFDRLRLQEFIWRPYCMEWPEIASLPEECAPNLWTSMCPLIHYNLIEIHHVERVTRQFGIVQIIPLNPDRNEEQRLHKLTRQGRSGQDWANYHGTYMAQWNMAHINVVVGTPIVQGRNDVVTEYYTWYRKKTRKLISPPSHPTSASGYRPSESTLINSLANHVDYILSDLQSIDNYNDLARFQELVDTHTKIAKSMKNLIIDYRGSESGNEAVHRHSTSSRPRRRSQVSEDLPTDTPHPHSTSRQWDTSHQQPTQFPYIPTTFEQGGPSSSHHIQSPYTPYFSSQDFQTDPPYLQQRNHRYDQFQPPFNHSPIRFEYSEYTAPTPRPEIRRSDRPPHPRVCFTGGPYRQHDHEDTEDHEESEESDEE